MEDTPKGRVTVISARINANLRAKTIEEIQAQRRNLHMGLVQNCVKEVKRDLHHEKQTAAFAQRKALDPSTVDKRHVSTMVSSIVDDATTKLFYQSLDKDGLPPVGVSGVDPWVRPASAVRGTVRKLRHA